MLLKHLIRSRHTRRHRDHLITALRSGCQIPRPIIAQLLCEDAAVDLASDAIAESVINDHLNNRNADHVLYGLSSGTLHVPHPLQEYVQRKVNGFFSL